MTRDDLRELSAALGDASIREHAPLAVDGCAARFTLTPRDGETLAAVLRVLDRRQLAALVRGGGSRLGLGNPPRRADLILSTTGLLGIDELDAEEGIVHLRGGTPLATLARRVREAGWELPLDPPGADATLGGALASAALGPRCQGFGRPRDTVLGLELALATGERVRCGGRVVKNVTGYDLQKLQTGALGTLGVIEGAWLRLRPRPERVELLAAALPMVEALGAGRAVARTDAVRAAAVLDPTLAVGLGPPESDPEAALLVIELAGDEPVVEAAAATYRAKLGARPVADRLLEKVRSLQGEPPGPEGLRVRVAARRSRVDAAADVLRGAGGRLLAYPGVGLVYACFALRADAPGGEALRATRAAARAGLGDWRVEEAPLAVKREGDVFGDAPEALAVMRALKDRYDPQRVLNPGRFVGGI